MTWGLAGAFAAAVTYGFATVLQAVGARQIARLESADLRLLWRLVHSTPYVLGLLLDGIGFALSLAALRTEPLFVVQAIVASSLAFTAVFAVLVLHTRLSAVEGSGLILVTAGLTLLGLSANDQQPSPTQFSTRLLLLVAVGVSGVLAAGAARRRGAGGASEVWPLGFLAGLMYGAGGIGARVLANPTSPGGLLVDPALWAMLIAGVFGLLLYAMALQRGSVTVATSAVVVAETLVPAAVGITLLGDRPAPGRTALAAFGFVVTVSGSLLLARYGEAPSGADRASDSTEVAGQTAGAA
ncbi:MAG TPA: hypothetical protein VFT62_01565 [Mycobacteriales bacterium]|nr:hypothetical protein [Mycobacteriales bacterium]